MASIVTNLNNEIAGNSTEMKGMDANRYATKKTIAQGMLDIALLTANASQLRYIIQVGEKHEFYKLMLVLISLSIIMQVLTGILLIILSLVSLHKSPSHRALAENLNHVIMALVFFSLFCDIIKTNFEFNPAIPVWDTQNFHK